MKQKKGFYLYQKLKTAMESDSLPQIQIQKQLLMEDQIYYL